MRDNTYLLRVRRSIALIPFFYGVPTGLAHFEREIFAYLSGLKNTALREKPVSTRKLSRQNMTIARQRRWKPLPGRF